MPTLPRHKRQLKKIMNVTKVTKTRQISATPKQWKAAKDIWAARRYLGFQTNLDADQQGIFLQLSENKKALNGLPVLYVCGHEGEYFNSWPYRALVLGAKEELGRFYLTIQRGSDEDMNGGQQFVEEVELYQILPVLNIKKPNKEDLETLRKQTLSNRITSARRTEIQNLDRRRIDYERSIISYEQQISSWQKLLKDITVQIKADKTPAWTYEEIINNFNNLAKNKYVENAWLKDNLDMVIETKMLYAIDREGKKHEEMPIGRMTFTLGPGGCYADNLDYACIKAGSSHVYPHPNIQGVSICKGANELEINKFARAYDYLELTDFLIHFFTLWPHDGGTPYVPFDLWMANKTSHPKINPWWIAKPIWSLYPMQKPKKIPVAPITPVLPDPAMDLEQIQSFRGLSSQLTQPSVLGVPTGLEWSIGDITEE